MSNLILDGNWKQHPTYSKYFFCDDGRVASTAKNKVRLIKGTLVGQNKYLAIPVLGSKKIYVHRTICELFNGPPKNAKVCRHLDGDKYNNAASNLSWGSHYDNAQDTIRHGNALFGEKNPMSRLTAEQVNLMREKRQASNTPYYKLAKEFNVSTMTAFRAVTKRSWK